MALGSGAVIMIVVVAILAHRDYAQEIEFWHARQSLIAESQVRAVSSWLAERRADTEVLAALPSVNILLSGEKVAGLSPASRREMEQVLRQVMDRFTSVYGYSGIYLVDADGRQVLRSAGSAATGPEICPSPLSVAEDGNFRIELHGTSPQNSVLVFSAKVLESNGENPAAGAGGKALGTVVLQMPLAQTLFSMLSILPSPTESGETVLVCRHADEVIFISPTSMAAPDQPFQRRKLGTPGLAASAVLLTGNVSGQYSDYRGEEVLATGRRIGLTGWGLVRKIDRSEVLSGIYQTAVLAGLVMVLALSVLGLLWRGYARREQGLALEGRIQQQQAILRMREYSQEVVDSVPAGLLVLSPDLHVLSSNRTFLATFGLRSEEVVGRRLDEVIQAEHPPYRNTDPLQDGETTEEVLLDVAVAGRGEKRPARLSIKRLAHQEGEGRLLLTIEDLTDSERLRAAAEASERRMRDLVQSVDVIVWEAIAGTPGFTFVSQRAEQILGYPVEQWLNEADFFHKHVHQVDRAAVKALRELTSAGQRFSEAEFRMLAADGRVVWVHEKVRVLEGSAGRPTQLRGVILDITESKRAVEERARLSSAVEQTAESVMITDLEGNIAYVNPAFERITGYRRGEVMGKNPRILKSGRHDTEFYGNLWRTITGGGVWSGFLFNKRKDGKDYEAESLISPVRDGAGVVVNYVAVQRDVTHERLLEAQLRQSQKMEAVGRLAGGIAHDFNNLLTIITGYSQLLADQVAKDEGLAAHVAEILKASGRAASLTRQLLAFGRRQVLAPRVLDLNEVVSNTEKMLRRLIGEDVELLSSPGENLGRVKADPGQIEQVMLNLAVNARDAMPEGGKLTIETSNAQLGEDYAASHYPVKPGRYVLLAVSDTGTGMDAETLSHIFEPFFTTKEQGKGTGLGLSTVFGIVQQSGGYITVYSEPDQGSTFKIYLPRVGEESVSPGPGEPRPESVPRGAETILLVEDEGALRSMVRGLLESQGYKVLEARNGEDALIVCEQHKGSIQLLLTDVVMPEMNGPQLAERLSMFHREMKTLYISGYTDEGIIHQGILDAGTNFLQKPFTPEALVRKVREVIGKA
jgi:two-component system cell cycle sensor histidine kinase/response regulator CckA